MLKLFSALEFECASALALRALSGLFYFSALLRMLRGRRLDQSWNSSLSRPLTQEPWRSMQIHRWHQVITDSQWTRKYRTENLTFVPVNQIHYPEFFIRTSFPCTRATDQRFVDTPRHAPEPHVRRDTNGQGCACRDLFIVQ